MLHVTVGGETYKYDSEKLLNTEAIALQKVTGMRMTEWTKGLEEGDAYAMTGLVWLLWRRNGREVAFDEVEFDLGSINVEDDEDKEPDPIGAVEAPPAQDVQTI